MKMNLTYCDFTRIGLGKVPEARHWLASRRPWAARIAKVHERLVDHCTRERRSAGPQDAYGHHGSGDQHSLPHRLQMVGDVCG